MSFLSLEFILFFAVFLFLYWSLASYPQKQNLLILFSSYVFVLSFSLYAACVLFCYSVVVWGLGRLSSQFKKQVVITFILVFVICTLFFFFKYYDAIREFFLFISAFIGFQLSLPILNLALPIGLSFYLFHSVSYLQSCLKENDKQQSFLTVLTYLSFFPSLVSGPINRAYDTGKQRGLLTQLIDLKPRYIIMPKKAFFYIVMAIFKLWVLSSYLDAWFVNDLFSTPADANTLSVITGIYAYAFVIYFNFSGYSELVLGIGMLMGFHLPINFRTPYVAENLKMFWDRWHISLSLFIKDYIYIPLGGSRNGFWSTQANVMVSMVLSGIWHGAGLTFILWGIFHGMGQVITNIYRKIVHSSSSQQGSEFVKQSNTKQKKAFIRMFISKHFNRLLTFHFICFTWVFFRANNIQDVATILQNLFFWDVESITQFSLYVFILLFSFVLLYPGILKLILWCKTWLISTDWPVFILIIILLMQLVIYIAPSGVPGFIYASF